MSTDVTPLSEVGSPLSVSRMMAAGLVHAAYHPDRWWSMPDNRRSQFSTPNNVFRLSPRAVWEWETRNFNASLIQDCGSFGATFKALDLALVVTGQYLSPLPCTCCGVHNAVR